ncbi:hypothetical protein M8J76_006511 [Diaphorina citri]|nr:hypothetical protein M8J75_008306 [Diaphorina citri]KAI5740726.1 hypothetical protein M8J76_006511 [Diaphorina citri]KAI5747903.1 hypothetical protein M8J77_019649 [Diaphorina citri]
MATGRETLPVQYNPLLHIQPQQYYEAGCYYATQQKYELALEYLDRVSDHIVNPDHLPVDKEKVKDVIIKSLKKKIDLCCKLWMFDKAREDLEALKNYTSRGLRALEDKIDDAYWQAAIFQLEREAKNATSTHTRTEEQSCFCMENVEELEELEEEEEEEEEEDSESD